MLTNNEIDEELYSRQLYVLGHAAMKKMQDTNILIIGMDGLGQEIAKNVILAGVHKVFIYDTTKVKEEDLGAGFYFRDEKIGMNKAEAIFDELRNINKYVTVEIANEIDDDFLLTNNLIVSVNQDLEKNMKINEKVRNGGVNFVMANSRGFFSQLFVDFNHHLCLDKTGENASTGMVNTIQKVGDSEYSILLADGSKHSLDENDKIRLIGKQNNSFIEIYAKVIRINGKGEFIIETEKNEESLDDESIHFDFEQIKTPFEIVHKSLKDSLEDNSKIVKYEYLHENDIHKLFANKNDIENKELADEFKNSENTLLCATCSVLGGFAAQEIIKGVSGKFMPLNQFFYHHTEGLYTKNNDTVGNRYKDIITLIGKTNFDLLSKAKIFLVGAGAIGCENLKNFVMSGLGSKGRIYVTDMDSIEKSNLNRQFLFKEDDVGMQKSECAAKNVSLMNVEYKRNNVFRTSTTPVKSETENVFSDKMIEDMDIVSNALDNVAARLYMDERCVNLNRPLIDAGTLGTKGHVQVVVPNITESYGSSIDAEQDSIPLCTIRSYPNCIEHTIEWALAEFKTEFGENTENAVYKNTLKDIVQYCINMFDTQFNKIIVKLLTTFPPDHKTAEGLPFWLPPKKMPHPIVFDKNDEMHLMYVESAVKLYLEARNEKYDSLEIEKLINTLSITDEEYQIEIQEPVEFEKDSWHADFIYSASNLRARNYGIIEQSKHYIRGVAGKIIPAIATTTAMVSGLATLEIMKVLTKSESVKNSFLDLAHPMLCGVDPIECSKNVYSIGEREVTFTMWDKKDIKNATLKEIIEELNNHYKDEVSMISEGSKILFWDISDKYKMNLDKKINEIVEIVDGQRYVFLTVLTEDDVDRETIRIVLE